MHQIYSIVAGMILGGIAGRLGSGTSGWVVIDSSDPKQQGFKSYDW